MKGNLVFMYSCGGGDGIKARDSRGYIDEDTGHGEKEVEISGVLRGRITDCAFFSYS